MNSASFGTIVLFFAFSLQKCYVTNTEQDQKIVQSKDTVYTFQADVVPLLQSNCNPCHFPGGKVYEKLPFDHYQTVLSLRKKLGTRLKQEKQQAIIDAWIEAGAKEQYTVP